MTLVVFLRGVNVGGHRTFKPAALAKKLRELDVVNIGAAGTFVVRKPGSAAKLRAAFVKALPFETAIVIVDARDILRIVDENPFRAEHEQPGVVRFVSMRSKAGRTRVTMPINLPAGGEWFVQLIDATDKFAFGVYRRHMKTVRYLGQVDKQFDAPVTTRNWNTINAIVKVLQSGSQRSRGRS